MPREMIPGIASRVAISTGGAGMLKNKLCTQLLGPIVPLWELTVTIPLGRATLEQPPAASHRAT